MSEKGRSLFLENGRELEMMIDDREARLAALNALLREKGLRQRPKLGDSSAGEVEILGIYEVICRTPQYHQDFFYACRLPGGAIRELPVRYNANGSVSDGSVMVLIINGTHLALVRQWRHPLGRYTLEIPRGFTEAGDIEKVRGIDLNKPGVSLPGVLTTLREGMEEIGLDDRLTVVSVTVLGRVCMDTGTSAGEPEHILVMLRTKDLTELTLTPQDREIQKVRLTPLSELPAMIGDELTENYGLSALLLTHMHMKRLGAPGIF